MDEVRDGERAKEETVAGSGSLHTAGATQHTTTAQTTL